MRQRVSKINAKVDAHPSLPTGARFGLHNRDAPDARVFTPEDEGLNRVELVQIVKDARYGRGLPPTAAVYEILKSIVVKVLILLLLIFISLLLSACSKGEPSRLHLSGIRKTPKAPAAPPFGRRGQDNQRWVMPASFTSP